MSNIVKYFFDQVIARERVVALREELRASLKSGGLRINRLLDFRGDGHVLDDEARHFETVLHLEHRIDQRDTDCIRIFPAYNPTD